MVEQNIVLTAGHLKAFNIQEWESGSGVFLRYLTMDIPIIVVIFSDDIC